MGATLTDPLVGKLVDGRYRVVSRIARGGMATVYLATDRRLDRDVALKVMHPHLADGADGADFISRFRREARAAARLTHPGLVAVFDQGLDGETSYLTMEFIDGLPIGERDKLIAAGYEPRDIGEKLSQSYARQVLDDARIAGNMATIKRIFERFLTFGDGPTDAVMVNNADWLDKLEYIPFLRDIGRHFSINRMLTFDSVKLRLDREQPLSFLEFNYMILQAYDYLELSRRFGCRLQMGGSDQWGNIVNGTDLIRRVDSKDAFGLTTPLITTADGAKMGKTANGAVWLHEDSLPSYDYWQFWRNTQDADVGKFMRLFTEIPEAEIRAYEALEGAAERQRGQAVAERLGRQDGHRAFDDARIGQPLDAAPPEPASSPSHTAGSEPSGGGLVFQYARVVNVTDCTEDAKWLPVSVHFERRHAN